MRPELATTLADTFDRADPGLAVPGQRGEREDGARRAARREADRGALHARLSAARVDRSVVRGRAERRRQADRVDAQPGRVPAARRHGARARRRARRASPASTRKARAATARTAPTTWPSTRRWSRARPGPAGEAAVDARRRVHVGAVRLGDDHEDARRVSTRRAASSTGSTSCGAIRTRRARAGARASICLPRGTSRTRRRRRSRPTCRSRRAAPIATRFRSTIFRASGSSKHYLPDAPLRTSALRTLGALCERLRARVVHGRGGGGGRRRPGRVPPAAPARPRARAVIEAAARKAGWQPGAQARGERQHAPRARHRRSRGTRTSPATARWSPKSRSTARAAPCA